MGSPPKTLQEIAEDIERDIGNKVSQGNFIKLLTLLK